MSEIIEGDEVNHQLLKRADYAGNTAVHLAAVGPNKEILRSSSPGGERACPEPGE